MVGRGGIEPPWGASGTGMSTSHSLALAGLGNCPDPVCPPSS